MVPLTIYIVNKIRDGIHDRRRQKPADQWPPIGRFSKKLAESSQFKQRISSNESVATSQ